MGKVTPLIVVPSGFWKVTRASDPIEFAPSDTSEVPGLTKLHPFDFANPPNDSMIELFGVDSFGPLLEANHPIEASS